MATGMTPPGLMDDISDQSNWSPPDGANRGREGSAYYGVPATLHAKFDNAARDEPRDRLARGSKMTVDWDDSPGPVPKKLDISLDIKPEDIMPMPKRNSKGKSSLAGVRSRRAQSMDVDYKGNSKRTYETFVKPKSKPPPQAKRVGSPASIRKEPPLNLTRSLEKIYGGLAST